MSVDPQGVYRGPPTQARIRQIQSLTAIDKEGKRYWRTSVNEGWRRLRNNADFTQLNEALSKP